MVYAYIINGSFIEFGGKFISASNLYSVTGIFDPAGSIKVLYKFSIDIKSNCLEVSGLFSEFIIPINNIYEYRIVKASKISSKRINKIVVITEKDHFHIILSSLSEIFTYFLCPGTRDNRL